VQLDGRAGLIHSALLNNFDYDLKNGKDDNAKCPFHAHIRKTNPRSGLKDAGNTPEERMKAAKARIMARRGITYGTRTDEPNDGHIYNKPEKEVGLLFMSYQASIEKQFEFIQQRWANRSDFPSDQPEGPGTIGIDPIIGQGDRNVPGDFATEWGNAGTLKPATFEQFVHLKGGEYFFAPSMHFLKNIATTTNSVIQ
jgi:deferrochelatase/peroxidase EfeB